MTRFLFVLLLCAASPFLLAQTKAETVFSRPTAVAPASKVTHALPADSVTYFVTDGFRGRTKKEKRRLLRLSADGKTLKAVPLDLEVHDRRLYLEKLLLRNGKLLLVSTFLNEKKKTITDFVQTYDPFSLEPIDELRTLYATTGIEKKDDLYGSYLTSPSGAHTVLVNRLIPEDKDAVTRVTVVRLDDQLAVTGETTHEMNSPDGTPLTVGPPLLADDGVVYFSAFTEGERTARAKVPPKTRYVAAIAPGASAPRLVAASNQEQRMVSGQLFPGADDETLILAGVLRDPAKPGITTGYYVRTFALPGLTETGSGSVFFAPKDQSYGLTTGEAADAKGLKKMTQFHRLQTVRQLADGDFVLTGVRDYVTQEKSGNYYVNVYHKQDPVVARLRADGTAGYVTVIPAHSTVTDGAAFVGGVQYVGQGEQTHLLFNDHIKNSGVFDAKPKRMYGLANRGTRLVSIDAEGKPTERRIPFSKLTATNLLSPTKAVGSSATNRLRLLRITAKGQATGVTVTL